MKTTTSISTTCPWRRGPMKTMTTTRRCGQSLILKAINVADGTCGRCRLRSWVLDEQLLRAEQCGLVPFFGPELSHALDLMCIRCLQAAGSDGSDADDDDDVASLEAAADALFGDAPADNASAWLR